MTINSKNKKLVGSKIGDIQIISLFAKKYTHKNKKKKRNYFTCLCICGNIFSSRCDNITKQMTKSCGCKQGDLISLKNRLPNDAAILNLIYRTYKRNANKAQRSFTLSKKKFINFLFCNCAYCGAEPSESVFFANTSDTRRPRTFKYNGIDRIDSDFGYTPSNCVTCCRICNMAKSNLTLEEFDNWIKRIVLFNYKRFNLCQ